MVLNLYCSYLTNPCSQPPARAYWHVVPNIQHRRPSLVQLPQRQQVERKPIHVVFRRALVPIIIVVPERHPHVVKRRKCGHRRGVVAVRHEMNAFVQVLRGGVAPTVGALVNVLVLETGGERQFFGDAQRDVGDPGTVFYQRDGRVDFPPASVHVQGGQEVDFLVQVEGTIDQREGQHDVGGGGVHETVGARQCVARVAFHHKLVFSVEVRITVEREILARGAERKVGPHAVAPMFGHDVEGLHVRVDALDGFGKWNVKEFVDAFAVRKEPHLEPRVVGGAPVEIEFGVRESNEHLSGGDVGAVAVPTFVLCVAADGVAVCVLGAGDVAASGVGERVDADTGERVARVEGAGIAVKTFFVGFRVDPVHTECVGAHVGVVHFVGGFERATDVGETHANIARFVGT